LDLGRLPTGQFGEGLEHRSRWQLNHVPNQVATLRLVAAQPVAESVDQGIDQIWHCVSQCPVKVEHQDRSHHLILSCQCVVRNSSASQPVATILFYVSNADSLDNAIGEHVLTFCCHDVPSGPDPPIQPLGNETTTAANLEAA
jgi:hypothetical protein